MTRGLCRQIDLFICKQSIFRVSFKFFRLIFNPILHILVVGVKSPEKNPILFPV